MGVLSRFGGLINLNTQQPLKVIKEESERSENVKSKPVSQKETNNNNVSSKEKEKVYYDEDEEKNQSSLWKKAEKKHKWYDAPPKVKVTTTKKGICHMNVEFTIGATPARVYRLMNPASGAFSSLQENRYLLKNKSGKVLMEDGPRKITEFENTVTWDIRGWTIDVPIKLIFEENKKDLTGKYKKGKLTLMFMKVFKGNWKVEPIYVDSDRLCKQKSPKSKEEYIKCSNGQGKIASRVIIDQYFQPYFLFNLPPLSSYIHETVIKITTNLFKMLQKGAKGYRESGQAGAVLGRAQGDPRKY